MLKKKHTILLLFLFFISLETFAQAQLGVKFSPSLVFNRLKIDSENVMISENGTGFRPSAGLIVEFPLADMYSFSTGVTYISKSLKLVIDPLTESPYTNKYSLQYIQIPLTLKLFTNEISIDKRLYFQTGFNTEVMIYNENKTDNPDAIKTFNLVDLPLVFGAGMEMNLGVSTKLFAGLSYQRGLINTSLKENFSNSKFSVKNDLVSIDIGLKF